MINTEWTEEELEFYKEAVLILKKASIDITTLSKKKRMPVKRGSAVIAGVHAQSLAINLAAICKLLGANKEQSNSIKDVVLGEFHVYWEKLT